MVRIDTRIRNRDLPAQMVITADNVTAMIDAVVYYKVVDPEKAALNVENYELAVKDRAKVVLRDIVGRDAPRRRARAPRGGRRQGARRGGAVRRAVGPPRRAHRAAGHPAPARDAGGDRQARPSPSATGST
jgi:regulator of protease activity HflC (stomatin/prohibitin superfamily)